MTTEATSRVVVTHRYAASPDRVFDAFLDVQIARRFLFATATGEMITAEAAAVFVAPAECFRRSLYWRQPYRSARRPAD